MGGCGMSIKKEYNPETRSFEFRTFDIVHSMVGGSLSGDDDLSKYRCHDGQTLPTEAELKTEKDRLEAEYDAQAYARNRKEEYDALNQFELISDDAAGSTTTHVDAIAAIKTKWPKNNKGPIE
jgi:hypothetical protein